MKRLLLSLHNWLHSMQRRTGVRIAASVLLVLGVLAAGGLIWNTAYQLRVERDGIVAALKDSNVAKDDPAGLQLATKATITANDKEYGGFRYFPNPVELFNNRGSLDPETKQDIAWRVVSPQVPAWMPLILAESPWLTVLSTLALAGVLLALVWLGLGAHLIEWGLLFGALLGACWFLEWMVLLRGLFGMALSLLLFGILWRLAERGLAARASSIAIARTTLQECVRSLAALGFAGPVIVLLPVLALSRDPKQGLYQAIPGFLDWGHTVVYTSAALLVLLFGCASTSFEIRDRQVWTVLTKPVSRIGWLMGKWAGCMVLGGVVLVGGGVSLYSGARYMAAQPAMDEHDVRDLRTSVFVARVSQTPEMQELPRERLLEIVDQEIERDATLRSEIENNKRDRDQTRAEIARTKIKEYGEQQRAIAPGQYREYTFRGLQPALQANAPISLKYQLHGGADDSHQRFPIILQFQTGEAKEQWDERTWVPGESYSYEVDPRFIDPNGTLTVRLYNAGVNPQNNEPYPGPMTIYFDPDGLEAMYPSISFGQNMVRGLLLDLAKLSFLGALAVASGAVLSFPVAVLLSFGIFSMATLTPFLTQSLRYYYPDEKSGLFIWAFQVGVKGMAEAIAFSFAAFSERAPSDALAQGRLIDLYGLIKSIALVGVLWSAAVLGIGWAAVARKEVAVYSGQG